MAIINTNKPLHAEAVYFKGRPDPLKNCDVLILGNFAIISNDPDEITPTWYNTNLIEKMEGITAETNKMHIG